LYRLLKKSPVHRTGGGGRSGGMGALDGRKGRCHAFKQRGPVLAIQIARHSGRHEREFWPQWNLAKTEGAVG